MKRLLGEPLVQFILIGAALFGALRLVGPAPDAAPASRTIQLSMNDLAQLVVVFQSQWKRDPTPEELDRLVENKIQDEILYREALALGLDKDDSIVKRRMAQKMQFLAEDVAASHEPTTEELSAWYAKHADAFAMPPRIGFRHVYFSPDRRGARARDDAAAALTKLSGRGEDAAIVASLGDPFMFQEYYRDRAPDFLGKEFGPQFATAVEKLPAGSWQGPVESGFGWHLVFVDTVIPGRAPAFDEIASDVRTAWLNEQKMLAWNASYERMRARYTVLLPAPPPDAAGSK